MTHARDKRHSLAALRRNYTNPHSIYDSIRANDSIYFDTMSQSWLVTGYEPITTFLSDPRFLSDPGFNNSVPAQPTALSFLHTAITRQMVFMDGDHHKKAQHVLLPPLSEMVKKFTPNIRAYAHNFLIKAQKTGQVELISDFAAPFSLYIIAEVLGIPTDHQEELLRLEKWSDTFINVTSGYIRGDQQDISRLVEYFRRLIVAKRRNPAGDLLSALIQAKNIFPDDDDIISNCIMIFGAGRVTTKKLLGNGIPLLLQQWSTWHAGLHANPTFSKLLGEELLRMVTPTRYLIRQAREDVDVPARGSKNQVIREGEKVLLFLEAGNHDPAIFPHPEVFDPYRRTNKQIAFGSGAHRCPGAALARLEIQAALDAILSIAELRAKPDVMPVWDSNPNLGGYVSFYAVLPRSAREHV